MINSVRNTVLAIANKNNFGYISPADFNLYAKQAQLDIFEDYVYRYNQWVLKQNLRQSGSGYADIVKNIEDAIDFFSVTSPMSNFTSSEFILPEDCYFINSIRYSDKNVEKVSNTKLMNLLSSNLTAPKKLYPVYTVNGSNIKIYPTTIGSNVEIQYIRYPKDPKWTYVQFEGGEPMFNASNADYQDIELRPTDEPLIVAKILQYVGISIREDELIRIGNAEEIKQQQTEG